MAWHTRRPLVGIAMLIGGDMVYKDMLKVAFGLQKPIGTIVYFETKKPQVDLSRNILASLALRDQCEWIFYLDADIIPPLDVIPGLISHNLPLVTALYYRRYERYEPCIYHMSSKGIPVNYTEEELAQPLYGSTLIEIEACGAGCMLIHSSVFEKLKPSVEKFDIQDDATKTMLTCWKFWEYLIHQNVNLSEDIVLASRAKGLGFKIFADLNLKCGHLTNVMVKDGRLKRTPLDAGREV